MKFLPKKYRKPEVLEAQAAAFSDRLAAAEKLEQPADRLEALLDLQRDMLRHAAQVGRDLGGRAGNFEIAEQATAFLGGMLGGGMLAVLVAPVIGVPLMIAGFAVLATADKFDFADWILSRMMHDISGHTDALKNLSAKSGGDIDDLLKNRSAEIAASEKFDSLYDRFPGIRDEFAKAFQKSLAHKEAPLKTMSKTKLVL